MKLVHIPLTPRIFTAIVLLLGANLSAAADAPEYLRFFNPAQGFKPAQINLTSIFLQLAGSLEHYGSPVPYIHHIQAESSRIAAKYKAKTGKLPSNHLPAYMTDAYIAQEVENWNLLSPKLGLDGLAKDTGRCARRAINGSRGKGTVLIDIFNGHQKAVAKGMEGGPKAGFSALQTKLTTELAFDIPLPAANGETPGRAEALSALVAQEKNLSVAERKEYASLLNHNRFTKAEFGEMEHFYKKGYDQLTESGKEEMSKRVWAGTHSEEPDYTRLEAITAALLYRSEEAKRFARIDAALPPKDAAPFKEYIQSVFPDLGDLAQAELELGILESAAR